MQPTPLPPPLAVAAAACRGQRRPVWQGWQEEGRCGPMDAVGPVGHLRDPGARQGLYHPPRPRATSTSSVPSSPTPPASSAAAPVHPSHPLRSPVVATTPPSPASDPPSPLSHLPRASLESPRYAHRPSVRANTERATWLPGLDLPPHLDGTLPGDFGFDPLRLGEEPSNLKWYVQAELVRCRLQGSPASL